MIFTAGKSFRAYVLAGGASARFGHDKALAEFEGQPMLGRMRELLRSVTGEALVIAPPGKYASIGVESIADRWPGEGPLGGIITALLHRQPSPDPREWNLILGCDMPFLTRDWLAYLVQRAVASSADVVTPRSAKGLEPLCACWRTGASPKLNQAFESGIRKITDAMAHLRVEIIDEAEWKRFDSAGRLFWNMNTLAEYEQARRIAEAKAKHA